MHRLPRAAAPVGRRPPLSATRRPVRTRHPAAACVWGAALSACAVLHGGLSAQGVRGTATTTTRWVQLRGIEADSVPIDQVTRNADGTFTYLGQGVACFGGDRCVYYRPGPRQDAVALTQDVSFTAWGLGVRGLSATGLLRARADLAGSFTWARSDDAFDAMLLYVELDRTPARFRLGRMQTTGGLGFSGYDGVHVMVGPLRSATVEAYGGRSLARGLAEPRNDVLRGLESFLLDRDAWLIGAAATAQPVAGLSIAGRYQREIWTDRSGLLSERAALDIGFTRLRRLTLSASADWDFAFERLGKADLTARMPVLSGPRSLWLEATARRYVPYFELWTIWGFFSPVAWHEVEVLAGWQPSGSLGLRGSAGWRRYDDTETVEVLSPLANDAARLTARVDWRSARGWLVQASYTLEDGFGAFLSSGDAGVRWQPRPELTLAIDSTAFQQIEQFRIGEGAVLGGAASGAWRVRDGLELSGGLSAYRQAFENRPSGVDWNQWRGWAALRIGFGRDPGMAAVTR